jgi:hypothetical protein
MKEMPIIPVEDADDRAYEKDPRFIEFIKLRLAEAQDVKNRIPLAVAMKEMRKKYGL